MTCPNCIINCGRVVCKAYGAMPLIKMGECLFFFNECFQESKCKDDEIKIEDVVGDIEEYVEDSDVDEFGDVIRRKG
ncbi:MAG: hypothetical protein KKF56_02955 [Nanoarchaeota archaeon]|nr:hypothetical protein [Nanoarchaeota archaeon]